MHESSRVTPTRQTRFRYHSHVKLDEALLELLLMGLCEGFQLCRSRNQLCSYVKEILSDDREFTPARLEFAFGGFMFLQRWPLSSSMSC